MEIIIKGRGNVNIADDLKSYIEGKVGSVLEKNLKEPTVCDVALIDNNGAKGGIDKEVHITVSMPDTRNPIHVEEVTDEFYKTVDQAANKLSRALHNARR